MPAADHIATLPVIVLLAAGESSRYGGIKQLAAIEGQPMVRRIASACLDTGLPVIVVTGANAARVEAVLADMPLRIARHAAWDEGMGSSLAAGVRDLRVRFPAASGVLLCLADQPMVDADALGRMLHRHGEAADRLLVTRHAGVSGPPVLFPRDCLEALAEWSGGRGAHALVEQQAARVEWFDSPAGVDVDTPADMQDLREWLATKGIRP